MKISRFLATGVVAAGALAVATTGVSAQEVRVTKPETLLGQAAARGFNVDLFGNALTLGSVTVEGEAVVGETVKVTADGVGIATPLIESSRSTVELAAPDQSEDAAQQCGAPPITVPGVAAELACAQSSGSTAGGLPSGTSAASVGTITVSTSQVLDTVGLGEVIDDAVTTVFDVLDPIFGGLDGTPLDPVDDTLKDLLDTVLHTDTAVISLGDTAASVTTTDNEITATATAQGGVIELLPAAFGPDLSVTGTTEPLARIEIGAATATATRNRDANTVSRSFDPAVVRVTLAPTLLENLGLSGAPNVIEVAPGTDTCLPLPEPLTTCITVGGGADITDEDGNVVGARSNGVRIHALAGVEGGVLIELAAAEAIVGGTPQETEVLANPVIENPTELPRTGPGSTEAVLPVIGMGLLAVAAAGRRLLRVL